MGEKRRIIFGIFVAGLLAGFAWLVLRAHEPMFQSKPLSYWLDQAYENRCTAFPDHCPEAAAAVRSVGDAAAPILLRMVGARQTTGRQILGHFAREFPFLHLPRNDGGGEIAAWAFGVLGPRGRPALAGLVQLLNDKDAQVRFNAARSLAGLGAAAREAVPVLIQALNQSRGSGWQDRALREATAAALGEIGAAAVAALPHLEALTNTPAAELAIMKIQGLSLLPFMERLKDTSDAGQWIMTAKLVGGLGTNAEPAIPLLIEGLSWTNRELRQPRVSMQETAVSALGLIHSRPDLCLPPMMALLDSPEPNLRYQTLVALRGFGAKAKPAVPAIVRCIDGSASWLWIQHEGLNLLKTLDPQVAGKIQLRPLR